MHGEGDDERAWLSAVICSTKKWNCDFKYKVSGPEMDQDTATPIFKTHMPRFQAQGLCILTPVLLHLHIQFNILRHVKNGYSKTNGKET